MITNSTKRSCLKYTFIFLLIVIIYLYINHSSSDSFSFQDTKTVNIPRSLGKTKPKAYIITSDCNSIRFNITKENIEVALPNFFHIMCYTYVPLSDPRIHTVPLEVLKKFSSNLITFLDLWTYEIAKNSKDNEYEWTFIFEDDVNFNNASRVSLTNYNEPLREFMLIPEIQVKDGFFYLGVCAPTYDNTTKSLISKNTNNLLYSQRTCGFCLHATAITAKRAQLFWTEVSSYRPNVEGSLDKIMQIFCIRSKSFFYTFGTNFHWPPDTEHRGIAYQDRGRFSSTVV